MLKKTITYKDLDGNDITEDFYFNLSKAEIAEMELTAEGGFQEMLQRIVDTRNGAEIIRVFKEILAKAYGKRSEDGRRFIKSPQLSEEFMQTDAFSELFMELVTDAEASAKFVTSIVPSDLAEKIETVELPTTAPQLEETAPEDNRPAWEREDRDPTPAEMRSMSKDELVKAMQRKNAQRGG